VDDEATQQMPKPGIEKREHRRARLVTQVRCEALGREEMLLSRDVSVGGVFVSSKEPFPLDSEIALALQLKAGGQSLSAQGKVVYSLKGLGMGIQFVDLSEENRTTLQKFVDEAA
jgi:PilZ domain